MASGSCYLRTGQPLRSAVERSARLEPAIRGGELLNLAPEGWMSTPPAPMIGWRQDYFRGISDVERDLPQIASVRRTISLESEPLHEHPQIGTGGGMAVEGRRSPNADCRECVNGRPQCRAYDMSKDFWPM